MTDHDQGRRYYLVEQAIGIDNGIDDWIFVNETEAMPIQWGEGYRVEEWGSRTVPGVTEGSVRYIGLPRLRATPRFILGKGKKTTIDAYKISGSLTIVSDRLKRLMEAIDPAAFEFAPVDATHGPTDAPELAPY